MSDNPLPPTPLNKSATEDNKKLSPLEDTKHISHIYLLVAAFLRHHRHDELAHNVLRILEKSHLLPPECNWQGEPEPVSISRMVMALFHLPNFNF